MKTRTKRVLLTLGLLLLAGLGLLAWLGYSYLFPRSAQNEASARACVLEWGRLAPFPSSAQDLSVTVEGGLFTRAFRASFTAPAADIEAWLQQSPGPREVKPATSRLGRREFKIEPGGGAQRAELEVDDIHHRVLIYVVWS